ncbi:hypothetical protein CUMW_135280 [Citrus unshiu]|nr:hypothetical protein CUMW_135280 [Citrus unshiu]
MPTNTVTKIINRKRRIQPAPTICSDPQHNSFFMSSRVNSKLLRTMLECAFRAGILTSFKLRLSD